MTAGSNVALTRPEANTGNAIAPRLRLRVQVLDCRSGAPVANARIEQLLMAPAGEALDPNKHLAYGFASEHYWSILSDRLIPTDDAGAARKTSVFDPQRPSDVAQMLDALSLAMPQSVADGDQDARDAFFKDAIAKHNAHFIHMIQLCLEQAGYDCSEDMRGSWAKQTEASFKKFQRDRLSYSSPFANFNRSDENHIKKLYTDVTPALVASTMKTDANGVLSIPVSTKLAFAGATLRVRFFDFAIAGDKPGFRPSSTPKPTGFGIRWRGKQDVDAGNWGWWLETEVGGTRKDVEFELELEFRLPAIDPSTEPQGWRGKLEDTLTQAGFNPFYSSDEDAAEIVVYAMVWSPPVYDAYEDPAPEADGCAALSEEVFVQPRGRRGTHMHLVTLAREYGTSTTEFSYGNQTYGMYFKVTTGRSSGKHGGWDIYAAAGDPIFQVHGGRAYRKGSKDAGAGDYISQSWVAGTRLVEVWCFHMSEFEPMIARKPTRHIRAGQVVGKAGRSGNLGPKYPGHTHFQFHYPNGTFEAAPNDANIACFPSNQLPLQIPCHGVYEDPKADPRDCNFLGTKHHKFPDTCWAVGKLACPYMSDGDGRKTIRLLQAQLRYLHREVSPTHYLDPGLIDGELGPEVIGEFVDWRAGQKLFLVRAVDDRLREVVGGESRFMVNRSELGTWRGNAGAVQIAGAEVSVTGHYILASDILVLGSDGSAKKITATRKAIWQFRFANKARGILLDGARTNSANYEMDADAQAVLDELAPVLERQSV